MIVVKLPPYDSGTRRDFKNVQQDYDTAEFVCGIVKLLLISVVSVGNNVI